MIPRGAANATSAGPKSSILFSAENYDGRFTHLFGQGAIVLENYVKGEVSGDMQIGDCSYNLNFYVQSGGGRNCFKLRSTSYYLNSEPIMTLSNAREIHVNAPLVFPNSTTKQEGPAAFQLDIPDGPRSIELTNLQDDDVCIQWI